MLLFFDTETTGLPRNWKAPASDVNNWPRLVQLAFLVYDREGNRITEKSYIVKPDGFRIPEEVSRIHGITHERAMTEGRDLRSVLAEFEECAAISNYLVAHNINFDEKIICAEFIRNNIPDCILFKKKICTMHAATDFCKISGPYGYKWPSLPELHYKLFRKRFEDAHDAKADIEATARCFWELKRLGVVYLS